MLKNTYDYILENSSNSIQEAFSKILDIKKCILPKEQLGAYRSYLKELSDSGIITSAGVFVDSKNSIPANVYLSQGGVNFQFEIEQEINKDYNFMNVIIYSSENDKHRLYMGLRDIKENKIQLLATYDNDFKKMTSFNCLKKPVNSYIDKNDDKSIYLFYRNDIIEFLFNNHSELKDSVKLLDFQINFSPVKDDIILSGLVSSLETINNMKQKASNENKNKIS